MLILKMRRSIFIYLSLNYTVFLKFTIFYIFYLCVWLTSLLLVEAFLEDKIQKIIKYFCGKLC